MNSLRLFKSTDSAISPATAWYLTDLGEFRGKQELYTRQSPRRLKALREHALIESAVSSNRIEGVSVEPSRVRDVLVSPKPLFRDRDEEEIRGYRDALTWIHQDALHIPISNETIQRLHTMTRGQIWDAGLYKEKDGGIVERYPDGSERVRFRTVSAKQTPAAMDQLVTDWQACLEERWVPPLIALAAFNLDFLCIHPFRDGNGRVSRLLWLLQSYQLSRQDKLGASCWVKVLAGKGLTTHPYRVLRLRRSRGQLALANKAGEAYTENPAGRRGHRGP